uniref:PHD-type domain-containing protein n=1 Tax=Ciona intestinalis TaxID=7719 RepID=F7BNR0_CIOIN
MEQETVQSANAAQAGTSKAEKMNLKCNSTTKQLSKLKKQKLSFKIKKAKHSKTNSAIKKYRNKHRERKKNKNKKSDAKDNSIVAIYVPRLRDILQTFPQDIVTCCFCHLPGNYLPGLGDLYGPYCPTFRDLTEYRKIAHTNLDLPSASCQNHDISEITVDLDKKVCYITTKYSNGTKEIIESQEVPTAKETEDTISEMSSQLRIMQTLDYLLSDSRKSSHKHRSHKHTGKIRIPGFNGTLKLKSSNPGNDTAINSDLKKLLPGIDTIIFIEPVAQEGNMQARPGGNRNMGSPGVKIATVLDNITVSHKFDTSDMWVHAPCAMNAPGVCLIQGQLFGLHTTATKAKQTLCNYCGRNGATMTQRNQIFHYLCMIPNKLD